MEKYDIIFVGAGPATIFGLLYNFNLFNKKILIIEKGKSLKERSSKEFLYGFAGAGAFSDGKLVANPYVGGDIKDLIEIEDDCFYNLSNYILKIYKEFSSPFSSFEWLYEDSYNISSPKLSLLRSKVCHIGTDISRQVFSNIEEYLRKRIFGIHYEEEVLDICKKEKNYLILTNKREYIAKKVVVAIGKRGNLIQKLIKNFRLKTKPNKIQIGVRVESSNKYLQDLIRKFYDYKIVMQVPLGRVRSFCCCGAVDKSAYVVVEKGEDFYSVNGHGFKKNPPNGFINFGVMCSLSLPYSKEEQIKLMQKINGTTERKILAQNIKDFLDKKPSTNLKYKTSVNLKEFRLGNLWDYYPEEVCLSLFEYLKEFLKSFELEGHFFAPEIKLVNPLIGMKNPFEIRKNLFLIGDCSGYTRSIIQAGITGILIGQKLWRN